MRLRIIAADGSISEKVVGASVARLGRDPACEVAFDAAVYPTVSGEHARIERKAPGLILTPRSQSNRTLLNDQPVAQPVALKVGDRIRLGYSGPTVEIVSVAEVPSGGRQSSEKRETQGADAPRSAKAPAAAVKDRATGKPLTLLHNIHLVVRPREFVCLLGPSGSGKSTLLALLSGRNAPDGGCVTINGEDLHANFEALKRDIAVVPQKDVLHESLALGTALRYTAELRLPPDIRRDEIEATVSAILDVVGLSKRRATLIRHLSGGQVKRASLANELMAGPSLLFVDEATSGLDEQTDREMMELFRQVADSGNTVVCITHNLANVEATCHLVVILTEGGRLAFIGTPDEARSYFGVARLGDVYRKLGEQKPEEWQTAFRSSPFFGRYVRERLPVEVEPEDEQRGESTPEERSAVNPFRQAWILNRRYLSIWRGDLQALLAMLGQSLLVAVLLGVVFGRLDAIENPLERAQRTVNLLFLLSVSCFWFGCNNAAKELALLSVTSS